MGERCSEAETGTAREIKVVLVDGSLACLGTLIDLSFAGARVRVPLPIEAGRKIEMSFDGHQHRVRATVIWSTKTEIDVAFESASPFSTSTARVRATSQDFHNAIQRSK